MSVTVSPSRQAAWPSKNTVFCPLNGSGVGLPVTWPV